MQVANCFSLFHFLLFLLAGISNPYYVSFFISKAMLCSSGQKIGLKRTVKIGLSNNIFAPFSSNSLKRVPQKVGTDLTWVRLKYNTCSYFATHWKHTCRKQWAGKLKFIRSAWYEDFREFLMYSYIKKHNNGHTKRWELKSADNMKFDDSVR